jgi:hypothetical protein
VSGQEPEVNLEIATVDAVARTEPTDLQVVTEKGRQRLVTLLVGLIALEILGFYVLVAVKSITVAEALELWGAFGPPTTGALGLAASHYFQHGRQPSTRSP